MNSRVLSPTFSTPSHRSSIASSRPKPQKFDAEGLSGYMKHLLSSTLSSQRWPELKERDKVKAWCKEIGERVKERMLHIQPQGFKYIITTQIYEKLGQGGRADLSCHWEDTDTVAQAMFDNVGNPHLLLHRLCGQNIGIVDLECSDSFAAVNLAVYC